MKKSILTTLFVAGLLFVSAGHIQKAYALSCYQISGASIFGYDSWDEVYKFIGAIANEYDSNSIANEFGAGNEFSSDSIFNEFGDFGSEFSSESAFNDFANDPPILLDEDLNFIGYLTMNEFKSPSINPWAAFQCAQNSYASSEDSHEDLLIQKSYIDDLGPSIDEIINLMIALNDMCLQRANSYFDPNDMICHCNSGYVYDSGQDVCVENLPSCPDPGNSYPGEDGFCYCKGNLVWNSSQTACVTPQPQSSCGLNSESTGNGQCQCLQGFTWASDSSSDLNCVKITEPNIEEVIYSDTEDVFTDVNYAYQYASSIRNLRNMGVLGGYPDGSFRPNYGITRAEFLKVAMTGKEPTSAFDTGCFNDVEPGLWYTPYICKAKTGGWVGGYPDGGFHPNDNITQAEAFKIALMINQKNVDNSGIVNWYDPFVSYVNQSGYLPSSAVQHDKNITRGEVSELIWNIIK